MILRRTPRSAFTAVELLLSVTVVILIAFLVIRPAGQVTRGKVRRIQCVNNLKSHALAFRVHEIDHPNPDSRHSATNSTDIADYIRGLLKEMPNPAVLVCPADSRRAGTNWASLTRSNISYFVNRSPATNQPTVFLFGDRNLSTNGHPVPSGTLLRVSPEINLGWTKEMHNEAGNIALGDGSVQSFGAQRLPQGVRDTGDTMDLLIP